MSESSSEPVYWIWDYTAHDWVRVAEQVWASYSGKRLPT